MTIESADSAATTGPTPTYTRATRLRGLCGGAVHLPGDPGYDAARMPWNVSVDQRPAAVAYPASAEEVGEVVLAAAAAGLRVAPQGTGHNAGPLRRPRRDGAAAHLGDDRRRDRRRAPYRPRRGRRAVARRGRGGRAARPRGAARLLPRRRGGRLLAGRRHRLVRPRARDGHQQRHGRRPGAPRRHAAAHRRRHQPGRVLGGPRRRRQLRHRHRDGVPALRHRDGVRRHADVGPGARREGAAGLGGVDRGPRRTA